MKTRSYPQMKREMYLSPRRLLDQSIATCFSSRVLGSWQGDASYPTPTDSAGLPSKIFLNSIFYTTSLFRGEHGAGDRADDEKIPFSSSNGSKLLAACCACAVSPTELKLKTCHADYPDFTVISPRLVDSLHEDPSHQPSGSKPQKGLCGCSRCTLYFIGYSPHSRR
jgi:hypothetical protein